MLDLPSPAGHALEIRVSTSVMPTGSPAFSDEKQVHVFSTSESSQNLDLNHHTIIICPILELDVFEFAAALSARSFPSVLCRASQVSSISAPQHAE